jgi:4-oxalocrotonate tautomerase
MPIIEVNLFEGRTVDQKRDLIAALTDAAVRTLAVPPQNVRVILREMSKDDFGIAGKSARDSGR